MAAVSDAVFRRSAGVVVAAVAAGTAVATGTSATSGAAGTALALGTAVGSVATGGVCESASVKVRHT